MFRPCFLVFALVMPSAAETLADVPRTIGWNDLLPKAPVLVDPLAQLTVNQRIELRLVAAARERQELGIDRQDDRGKLAERNLTRKLQDQGLDVDALVGRFEAYQAKVLERNRMVDPDLEGERVRLKGHLLPLVESKEAVTEFLLVPYVGACVHVPPPPANQVVAVRTAAPFKSPGQFTNVRITGRIATEPTIKMLYLVDGAAAVPSAYTMVAETVEITED